MTRTVPAPGTSAPQSRATRSPTTMTVSAGTRSSPPDIVLRQRGAVLAEAVERRERADLERSAAQALEQLHAALGGQRASERRARRRHRDRLVARADALLDGARARPPAEPVVHDRPGCARAAADRSRPTTGARVRCPAGRAAARCCRSRARPRRSRRARAHAPAIPSRSSTPSRARAPPRRSPAAPATRGGWARRPRRRAGRRSPSRASNSTISRRPASVTAHSRPAGPAPTIATRAAAVSGARRTTSGAAGRRAAPGGPSSGLTEHRRTGSNARQSSLQATHGRTAAARPPSSLRGMSGSAISARAIPTRSAPAASAASIVSGVRNACEISRGRSTDAAEPVDLAEQRRRLGTHVAHVRRAHADGEVHVVGNRAHVREHLGGLTTLVPDRQPNPDRDVGSRRADRAHDAVDDREPFLGGCAVRPPVRLRRQELREQVAVRGVQLDHLEARLGRVDGRDPEALDDRVELAGAQLPRSRGLARRPHGRRGHRGEPLLRAGRLSAEVHQLARRDRALGAYRLGASGHAWHGLGSPRLGGDPPTPRGLAGDHRAADRQHRRAAGREPAPVVGVLRQRQPVLDEPAPVRRTDEPVAQLQVGEIERLGGAHRPVRPAARGPRSARDSPRRPSSPRPTGSPARAC